MSEYKCEYCNYITDRSSNIERHKKSKKHINNIRDDNENNKSDEDGYTNLNSENNRKSYKCKYCCKKFATQNSMYRHMKHTCKQKNNSDIKESKIYIERNPINILIDKLPVDNKSKEIINCFKQFIEMKDEENKKLDEENKKLIGIIGSAVMTNNNNSQANIINAETTNKSVNLLTYAIKNLGDAPPMKLLEGSDLTKLLTHDTKTNKEKSDIEYTIICKFENKNLHKYIGDIIKDTYKKDNPKDQSIWLTDNSRLSFIIKQLVVDTSGRSEWIADKSGVKLTNYIITPILNEIGVMLKKYACSSKLSSESDNSSDSSGSEYSMKSIKINKKFPDHRKIEILTTIKKILLLIANRELHKSVLRYISPYFGYDIDKIDFSNIK